MSTSEKDQYLLDQGNRLKWKRAPLHKLSWEYIEKNVLPKGNLTNWNLKQLSQNPQLTIEIIKNNLSLGIDIHLFISTYVEREGSEKAIALILDNLDLGWDFHELLRRDNLSRLPWKLIFENLEKIKYLDHAFGKTFDDEAYRKEFYQELKKDLSRLKYFRKFETSFKDFKDIPPEIVEEMIRDDWNIARKYMTPEYIEENVDKFLWPFLVKEDVIGIEFIKKHEDVKWEAQILKEKFGLKFTQEWLKKMDSPDLNIKYVDIIFEKEGWGWW
jgi:hypothetical protein